MQRYFLSILLLTVSLFVSGCGGNASNTSSTVFSEDEKSFLHTLFLTEYLWYEQVPQEVAYDTFEAPQQMIDGLKVSPDRWSFTLTKEEYEAQANQIGGGFGFSYQRESFDILFVRIDAPAYGKLFRGDKIVRINEQNISSDLLTQASQNLNTPTTFEVLRKDTLHSIVVTPSDYTFHVSLTKIISQNEKNIGYLRYDSFTQSSVEEIEEAFDSFKQSNIDELVIDLRYNGGGSLATASTLLDNLTNQHPSQPQFSLVWNENYPNKTDTYFFEEQILQDGNELSLKRIFFLVTANSASASEAIISAMVPYLGTQNVITIGSATHGKPVGMQGRTYGNNYYFLINFILQNANSQSSSFDGIAPTCIASDDITHLMGDTNETMLKSALFYIEHNDCP